jgi:hypothetical protein
MALLGVNPDNRKRHWLQECFIGAGKRQRTIAFANN